MSSAKHDILNKIHRGLTDVPKSEKPEDVTVNRNYRMHGGLSRDEVVKMFAERAGEYKATVHRVGEEQIKKEIAISCRKEKVQNLVIPDGFPENLIPDTITPMFDSLQAPLSHHELDQADGVITMCAFAIAQTGSIILDAGQGQGRRVLTLLPDYHLCIVRPEQIVELVPEGFSSVESSVQKENRPITIISGPSATSDIELIRVEGVHGPRRLGIIIIDE